jgi:mRNA interferase MazF
VVVQADLFNPTHSSLTVCPITSDCVDAPLFRVTLPPGERTGLAIVSQVMIDKVVSVPRSAIAREVGRCDALHLELIDEALRHWLDL